MRKTLILAVLLAIASDAHAAKRAKKPPPAPPPIPVLRLVNAEQTAEDANSGAGSPLLEWMRDTGPVTGPNGAPMDVIPDFRVTARSPVVMRRRELVNSDGAFKDTQAASYAVDIPAGTLTNGVIASGGWECGTAKYFITMRSYVIDADGKHSNALRYTIHCNGG